MRALEPGDVLTLWERGATRHPLDRSALLCAWARPEVPAEMIADLPLGVVTASLLALRTASFGSRIRAHVDCERCGERLELNLTAPEMLQPVPAEEDGAGTIEAAGMRVRVPSLRDLAAVFTEHDAECGARQLLARCLLSANDCADRLSDATMREVEDALEAIDPNADLAFNVHCEACGKHGTAQLDAGALLWDEIDARARALLGEVHLLARAYGWTESEILALGASRRAAYLGMVTAR